MSDQDVELARTVGSNHGVFTAADATRFGIDERGRRYRVSAGRWRRLYQGVYQLEGTPTTWRSALVAACCAGGELAAASHRSAAKLWGLAGGREGQLEISCPRWRRSQHRGLLVHETKLTRDVDFTAIDGIPVTSVARTLLDLGAVCRSTVVEMALDGALRRDLVSLSELRTTVDELARRGRDGCGILRGILADRSPENAVPESEPETRLRRVLIDHGLPVPVPQFVVRDHGRFVARVDFAYPDERIAIEYDSYEHHTGKLALVRDSARRNQLTAIDWSVVTATMDDLRSGGDALCVTIRSRLGVKLRCPSVGI
jgi:hypothetical protein